MLHYQENQVRTRSFFYCASSHTELAYLLYFFKDAFLHTVSGFHAKHAVSLGNKTLKVT